jgi:hypothetical protein
MIYFVAGAAASAAETLVIEVLPVNSPPTFTTHPVSIGEVRCRAQGKQLQSFFLRTNAVTASYLRYSLDSGFVETL